ncbi:uncharacterized protein A4U43_C05F12130 [Asparagus officinalis]|uniref:protein-serine/threonine phosphatase n=1 Tax=Asparagus officinalis TaxID=4686 RepID=A0A5P1ERA8_ASPOF|nr:uncharacterized protein A4U43_C05F12130 [Asparagus officinalis]
MPTGAVPDFKHLVMSVLVVNREVEDDERIWGCHGGVRAAEYVKQNLFSNLINHPKFRSDTKSAIAEAYSHTDSEFLKSETTQNKDVGSTASTAILVGDKLLVANVGDSRVVMCKGGKAVAVSRDHKPDQTDERQRIEDAGGFVLWAEAVAMVKPIENPEEAAKKLMQEASQRGSVDNVQCVI